ncbi:unnamed protein product, partial [Symbiodinium pilosum]
MEAPRPPQLRLTPQPPTKSQSTPALRASQLRGPGPGPSEQPMSKRYDVSIGILGKETSKPRPALQAVLRSMRRPIHEIHGLDTAHWLASVERARSAERRRRGGVDKRPVPSWNFRGGGPLQPITSAGAGAAELVKEKDTDLKGGLGASLGASNAGAQLRQKLDEQLRRQEELQRQLAQLQHGEEEAKSSGVPAELPRAPERTVAETPAKAEPSEPSPTANIAVEMDDEAVLQALEEQQSLRRSLRAKLRHLLGDRSEETTQDPK